jgi:hypothetical protein
MFPAASVAARYQIPEVVNDHSLSPRNVIGPGEDRDDVVCYCFPQDFLRRCQPDLGVSVLHLHERMGGDVVAVAKAADGGTEGRCRTDDSR